MSSKVVIVEYHYQEAFKVPKGMDLEDKTQVQDWWVKWNKLKILLVDGTVLEIQPEWDCVGDSMKRPSEDPTIEDAEDYGFEEEEEEEEVGLCLEDYEAYQNGAEFQEMERRGEAIKKKMKEKKEKEKEAELARCFECNREIDPAEYRPQPHAEGYCGYCCDEDGNPYFTCGKCEGSLFIEKDMKKDSGDEYNFDLCLSCYAQENGEWVTCVGCECEGDPAHFMLSCGKYTCQECWT